MRVTLRKAKPADSRFVWRLRNRPEVRAASVNANVIPWREHAEWFPMALEMVFKIISVNGKPCGYIRLNGSGEISIALSPRVRGRGVGGRALALFKRHHFSHTSALVRADNVASIRLFQSAGYEASPLRIGGFMRMAPSGSKHTTVMDLVHSNWINEMMQSYLVKP